MISIGIVLPYFLNETGRWPDFVDLFFLSCKNNQTVDFLVFTDDTSMQNKACENIHVYIMTWDECKERINNVFGPNKVIRPYKLCDLKPTYGVLFSEELKNYDYWGFCDCDLIFGDIRGFFPDDLLSRYDHYGISGHFQMNRNNENVNRYFLLERGENSPYRCFTWESVISYEGNMGFDESRGVPTAIIENNIPALINMHIYADIYSKYRHMLEVTVRNNSSFQYWKLIGEKLFHVNAVTKKKTERLYIHIPRRSMSMKLTDSNDTFYIYDDSFTSEKPTLVKSFSGIEFLYLIFQACIYKLGDFVSRKLGVKKKVKKWY